MNKKSLLFFMALLSGISLASTSSFAQISPSPQASLSTYLNIASTACSPDGTSLRVSGTMTFVWAFSSIAGGQWTYGPVITVIASAIIPNDTINIAPESGSITIPFNNIDIFELPLGSNCNNQTYTTQTVENALLNTNAGAQAWIQGNWEYTDPNTGDFYFYPLLTDIVQPQVTSSAGTPPPNAPVSQTTTLPPCDQNCTQDPVNIFSGESNFSSTDFSLGSRGPKLDLFRKYRSFSTFSGMFGFGWRTDFDANLTTDNSGDVIIYDSAGSAIYFMNNSGNYTPSPGNFSTLVQNTDGSYTVTDKYGIVTHYGLNGRLMSCTDRNGNVLSFVYNPTSPGGSYIQDASGRKIVLNFDFNNHIISAVDPAGKTFQYGYDSNGNLVSIKDPTGAVTDYYYDPNHKITQFTNANGHNSYFQYNTNGQVTMNWQDNNVNKVTLNYQANNTTVVTDSLGNNNTYVYNSIGLLLSHTDPLGAVTQQTWDGYMNRTSKTDARNNVTNFLYDYYGNLIQITDPLGNHTTMSYTPKYNLISSKTDASGNFTNFIYDNNGNLTTIIDALGNKHSFVYNQYGKVITATDSRGNTTNFTYDSLSHVIQKTDALGNDTVFTYE